MIETSQRIADKTRVRAAVQLRTARIALALIVLTIVSGAAFFFFAGYLSSIDDANRQERASGRLESVLDRVGDVRTQLSEAEAERNELKKGSQPSGPLSQTQILADQNVEKIKLQLKILERQKGLVEVGTFTVSSDNFLSPTFFNTTASRILVVVLLIFLVKILSGIYIYSIRMAAHYEGVADAIELTQFGLNGSQLSAILSQITSDSLTFPGQSPLNESIVPEVIKALASLRSPPKL